MGGKQILQYFMVRRHGGGAGAECKGRRLEAGTGGMDRRRGQESGIWAGGMGSRQG